MNILSFNNRFPDEQSCRDYLKQKREDQGLICKRCGSMKHYWFESRELWKCSECGSWTNLRANTIMHKSKVPVRTWFLCIHLMTSIKKSMSALEMQRQLGMKRYEPVWYMMQKIRLAMGKRDKKYKLTGNVEVDDSFFEIVDLNKKDDNSPDDQLKAGRGSQRQKQVLVMVESTPNPKQLKPHTKKRIMGFVKMITMDDLTSIGINYELQQAIERRSTIWTDGFSGYFKAPMVGLTHARMVVKVKEAHEKLPWVHTMISNAKRLFLGVHHSINKKYLQNYLNEYCWKLNRRTFQTDLFDRMIIAGASDTWF
jgi:transposase-like protein